jgi:hypothetical protein
MTTSERLVFLSGLSGVSAGAHLYSLRQSGVTAGQILVSRSSLSTATAEQHLLDGGGFVISGTPKFTGFHVNMGTMMNRM